MADSYYTVIRGKKYDRRMLELAEGLTKGRGDGRISVTDAKNLLRVVKDSNNYSATEKQTMEYIRKHYKFTKEGDEFFRSEIRKWAAGKGKKKAAAKPKKAAARESAAHAATVASTPVPAPQEAPAFEPAAPAKKGSPLKEILLGLLLLAAAAALFYFIAFKTNCGKNLFNRNPATEAPKAEVPPPDAEAPKPAPAAEAAKPESAPAPAAAKPAAAKASPELKAALEKTHLIFIAEKTELTPTTLKKIEGLAPRLKAENVKIQLTGHTCAWGPKELNQKISEKRAQVAKEAFVARGVPAENIETRGIADAETIGDQKTVAGRVASRRVTFKVLQ
ncbi:MAG: OmpA family protein [Spirochaetes bacterium]|nr:OmpA family protein [Spirochaetota bacterium]